MRGIRRQKEWQRRSILAGIAVILSALIFTVLDGVVHYSFEALEVYYYPIPPFLELISSSALFWYAAAKFVSTGILGVVIIALLRKKRWNDDAKILLATVLIVALLEIRYLISGYYGTAWHIYNTIIHLVTLFASAEIMFRILGIIPRCLTFSPCQRRDKKKH